MANILREATIAPLAVRRPYLQVDQPPNLAANFFPKVAPFSAQAQLVDQFPPRKWAQDFQQGNFQTQGIPPQPRDPRIFRAPLITQVFAVRRLQPDVAPNLVATLYALAGAKPPFVPGQIPDAPLRRYDRDFMALEVLSYLPGPVTAPNVPPDLPTPMRARSVPQDFAYQGTITLPTVPFSQEDWPENFRRRHLHQDFLHSGVTTRNIPAGVAEPFDQYEWPVLMRPKWAQADSYASPRILLITQVAAPFAQTDFPNPYPVRRLREDWIWPGTTTRNIPPVPPPSGPFDAVYLEGYTVALDTILLRWSASLGTNGYRVYVNGVPQATELFVRFAQISGLAINTQYVFNVVCVNAFGVDASILSNSVVFEHGTNETAGVYANPTTNSGTLH